MPSNSWSYRGLLPPPCHRLVYHTERPLDYCVYSVRSSRHGVVPSNSWSGTEIRQDRRPEQRPSASALASLPSATPGESRSSNRRRALSRPSPVLPLVSHAAATVGQRPCVPPRCYPSVSHAAATVGERPHVGVAADVAVVAAVSSDARCDKLPQRPT